MGWFDEQVKVRRRRENENFCDSMEDIASVIVRKKTNPLGDCENIQQKSILDALNQIFRYYHLKMIQELPGSIQDQEEQIEYLCRPYGIMRRKVKLEQGWYKEATGAFLGFKKDGTVVALIPDRFSGYYYHDIRTGKRIKLNKSTASELEEDAISIYRPFPAKKMTMYDLMSYAVKCVPKSSFLLLFSSLAVVACLNMIMPEITYIIFYQVVPSESMQMFMAIAIFAICLVVSGWLVQIINNLASERIGTEMGMSVQSAAMARVMSLSPEFFMKYGAGELTTKIKHFNALSGMIYSSFIAILLGAVFTFIYLIQIIKFAPALLGVTVCTTLLSLLVMMINTYIRMKIKRQAMMHEEKKSGFTYALLHGIQKIKLAGAEKRTFTKWVRLYTKEVKYTYGIPTIVLLGGPVCLAISLIGTLIMYYLAVKSGVSVADYYAFTTAYGMLSGTFTSLAGVGIQMAYISPTVESIRPIMEAVPEVSKDKIVVSSLRGTIELNHISFRYNESMPWVIDDLSLKILPGQYVAVVGKSGCGKSTLLRLMLGFETPIKGTVSYDGKNMERLDMKSLRRKMGVVLQNSKLFHGDIYENIAISAPGLTMEEAWEAAEKADIANDIREMPMGMHTMITEGSGSISGGQRQRLMIARAIASKPSIIMLDEATSALDNISQRKVIQSLEELDCTKIVIAHRLSTVKHCDRIIVIDEGKIVEDGDFDSLMEKNGLFTELIRRQMIKEDTN